MISCPKKNTSSQLLNSVQNSSFQMVQWYHVLEIYEASQLNAKQFLSSGWCGKCSTRIFFHTRIVMMWKMFDQMYNPCFLSYPDRPDFRIKTITSKLHSRYDCVGIQPCSPPAFCSPSPPFLRITRYKKSCHKSIWSYSSQCTTVPFKWMKWKHVQSVFSCMPESSWCGERSIPVFFHTRIVLILVFKITSKLHSRYQCVGTEPCRPPTLCSPCPLFLRHIMRYNDIMS